MWAKGVKISSFIIGQNPLKGFGVVPQKRGFPLKLFLIIALKNEIFLRNLVCFNPYFKNGRGGTHTSLL